jgi:16S rRNA (guanine527-N7)-methyltransferase
LEKKIKVVNEIAKSLDLQNVAATQSRVEDISFRYDFVVSRAVISLPEFVQLTKKNITRRSIIHCIMVF